MSRHCIHEGFRNQPVIDVPSVIAGKKGANEYLNLASIVTLEDDMHVQNVLNESSIIEQSILHTGGDSVSLLHVKIYSHETIHQLKESGDKVNTGLEL